MKGADIIKGRKYLIGRGIRYGHTIADGGYPASCIEKDPAGRTHTFEPHLLTAMDPKTVFITSTQVIRRWTPADDVEYAERQANLEFAAYTRKIKDAEHERAKKEAVTRGQQACSLLELVGIPVPNHIRRTDGGYAAPVKAVGSGGWDSFVELPSWAIIELCTTTLRERRRALTTT